MKSHLEAENNKKLIVEIINRRVENIFPSKKEVVEMLSGGDPLRFYYGIDPTSKNLHIGHTVQLFLLKQLHEFGHKIIVLFGDFTARVGDPTGKDTTRVPLTEKQIKENEKDYVNQISKILPRDYFEVKYNSEWLEKMSFKDILRLTSQITVHQMLARDMFQERIKKEKEIKVHEFLYPLMQGYDSVAMEVDGEVGGNDQVFNMLVGRDLVKEYLKKEKIVLATKLLINTATGKKISKTEKGFICLTDEPQEIRRKVLDLDDSMTKIVFELCTEKDLSWIEEAAKSKDPRQFKEDLTNELVRIYQGEKAVSQAHKPRSSVGAADIISTIIIAGIVPSRSRAKDLIDQGAVEINGKVIKEWTFKTKKDDIIKVGKGVEIKLDEISRGDNTDK